MSEDQLEIGEVDVKTLNTCINCGRCTSSCPVAMDTGLNVRMLALDYRMDIPKESIFRRKDLWECTMCELCKARCPREIDLPGLIMNLRSYQLKEGKVPPVPIEIGNVLESVLRRGNPWGEPQRERDNWADTVNVKRYHKSKSEILWFLGCAYSYDLRNQETARSMARVFNAIDLNYGILGKEETCCGHEMERLGERSLFEMQAKKNVEKFNELGVDKILTCCPHGFNSIKNDYPKFGLQANVQHYTQLLAEMIENGELKFAKDFKKKVTFHDSCYLGRINNIYDPPRKILKAIPGLEFVEMERNRVDSFCCGGGGGNMWREYSGKIRPSEIRIRESVKTGAEVIAVTCPFCMSMLEDAVKTQNLEGDIVVKDVIEIVEEASISK